MQINEADVAELVDARDLKSLQYGSPAGRKPLNSQGKSSECFAQMAAFRPAELAAEPTLLQNISRLGISVNKVRARGRRYAYLRGTDIVLVRGFQGSDADFDTAIIEGLKASGYQVKGRIDGYRSDAADDLLKGAKNRSARKGITCTLTAADITSALEAAGDRCEITGLAFDYGPKKNADWRRRPMAPSLDRRSNKGGYDLDNIRVVCVCVNIAINEWGLENFEKVCQAFVKNSGILPPHRAAEE